MNDLPPPHAAELSLHQTLKRIEDYVRREPTKATVAALGAGLVLNLIPARLIAKAAATVAATIAPHVLLGLGVLKAFEVCCEKDRTRMP